MTGFIMGSNSGGSETPISHAAERAMIDSVGPMTDGELQAVAHAVLVDCATYCDTELSPLRAEATAFYLGHEFGNEEEGRSRVILTEVRDTILSILPSMLRVFCGSRSAVKFRPTGPNTVKMAQMMTAYAQYVVMELNNGFLMHQSTMKDGLVKKVGAVKWIWDESDEMRTYKFENLTEAQVEALAQDENVTINRIAVTHHVPTGTGGPARYSRPRPEEKETDDSPPDPETPPVGMPTNEPVPAGPLGGPQATIGRDGIRKGPKKAIGSMGLPEGASSDAPEGMEPMHDVEITLNRKTGRVKIYPLPPEEFIYSREARDIDDAVCVAHRTHKTRSELRAMGVDEAQLDAHSGDDESLRTNLEEIARRRAAGIPGYSHDVESGEYNDKVLFCEAYIHVDYDGDGISELRRICTLGNGYFVISNEPAAYRPFAMWTPDPEPHTIVGQSMADRLMDIQRWKSMVARSMNDSLALAINPRIGMLEGQVNYQDVLNTDVGAPIRMRTKDAIIPINHKFVGADAMPVLEYIDQIVERRTGRNKGAAGMDADALQSTEKQAAAAAIQASTEQIEMLCRIYAEQFVKRLYKGIVQMVIEHQPRKQMLQIAGEWVELDPRSWDEDMEVVVEAGLGHGDIDRETAARGLIAQEQRDILDKYGPANPMVTVAMYADNLREMAALQNLKNGTDFFKVVDPNWQPPPPNTAVTPAMLQAQAQIQIEQLKSQRELAIKEAELELKRQQQAHDQMIAEKKIAMDFVLRRYQINAQFHANYTEQIADMEATQLQAWMDGQQQRHEQRLAEAKMAHEQALAAQDQDFQQQQQADQQAHDQMIAQQTATQAAPDQGEAD